MIRKIVNGKMQGVKTEIYKSLQKKWFSTPDTQVLNLVDEIVFLSIQWKINRKESRIETDQTNFS